MPRRDGGEIRVQRVAPGPRLVKIGRRTVARPTVPPQSQLAEDEIFARMTVHDLPARDRLSMLKAAAQDGTAGGRIYDAHIADVARTAGAGVIVPDNRRHFVAALRHAIRVETPSEFLAGHKHSRE